MRRRGVVLGMVFVIASADVQTIAGGSAGGGDGGNESIKMHDVGGCVMV